MRVLDLLDTQLAHLESRLIDTCRLGSGSEHVHLVGQVIGRDNSHRLLEEIFCRVHQIELGLSLHQLVLGWVIPYGLDGLPNFRIDMSLGAGLDSIVEQKFAVCSVFVDRGHYIELVHRKDHGLGAFNKILEDGRPIVLEFLLRVSAQMNNLHLLDYRRLSTLTGPYATS